MMRPLTPEELEDIAAESEALYLMPRAMFDACLLGIVDGLNVLVYNGPAVVQALMRRYGMSLASAQEWFVFQIARQGDDKPGQPLFMWPLSTARLGERRDLS